MTRSIYRHLPAITLLLLTAFFALPAGNATARQYASPSPGSCATATPMSASATPMADMNHGAMGTPAATDEFDQGYIDMMIPHHASIIALAHVALPRLTDERLRSLAETVIAEQTSEIDELQGYRTQFYGSPNPMPVAERAMMGMMGGMSMSMDEMMVMMDADALVATFCASADSDMAFIDLTIPHHQSAISASEVALQQSMHTEIRSFAERVIADQQREIDELSVIRQELYGSSTPAPVSASGSLTY